MNCDDVFDVLTRGPFPSGGADDGAVEHHLSGCHECRSLAEALRPAVDLFHESLSPGESQDLPGYRGRSAAMASSGSLVAAVAEAIESVPRSDGTRRRSTLKPPMPSLLWPLAAALVISAITSGMLWAMRASNEGVRQTYVPTDSETALTFQPTGEDLTRLVALGLPRRCRPPAEGDSVPATVWHCCTDCHTAAARPAVRPPLGALAVVMGQCGSCH